MNNNQSPHGFDLKASQLKLLGKVEVIFYLDDGFETFLPKAFKAIPKNIRKIALSKSKNLTLFSHREGTPGLDPHIWLSVKNAKMMVLHIAKELTEIYPENRITYKNNAALMISKLDALDAELKSKLQNSANKPFVTFHDAYQYFEKSYDLDSVGSITIEPQIAPSAKRIKNLRDKIQASGVRCVFTEIQFDSKIINTIKQGDDTKIAILDPEIGLGIALNEDFYFQLMRQLAESFSRCFGG